MSPRERIAIALNAADSGAALTRLAHVLRDGGVQQAEMESLYRELYVPHREDEHLTKFDVLLNVLTLIIGECSLSARISPRSYPKSRNLV